MEKLKDVRYLTTAGLLLAAATVLGFLKIPITQLIELRFQFLPVAMAGLLMGPAVGGMVGALTDILAYLVRPTGPYFPGFTLSSMLTGLIFGLILYKKPLTVTRLLLAQAAETVLVSMLFNSFNLSLLYGNPFPAVFAARFLKCLVMFPVNALLLTGIMRPSGRYLPAFLKTGIR
ncbi:MAG: folate family ECF transporter S component [bacterium]